MGIFNWRGRLSAKNFRKRFIESVAAVAPQLRCMESAENDLEFSIEDVAEYRNINVSLHRAYQEFEAAPVQYDEIFERWHQSVRHLWQPKEPFDKTRIVPMIKDRAWLSATRTEGEVLPDKESPDSFWYEDINEELIVVYAVHGAGFSYPARSVLLEEDVAEDEIRDLALANLRARTPDRSIDRIGMCWSVNVGGNFEASLLVDGDTWGVEPFANASTLLVAVPERDLLLASTDTSVAAVWNLASMAAHGERTQPYPISSQLMIRDEGRFRLLNPEVTDDGHPVPVLDVIDLEAEKNDGTHLYCIIVATPLQADPRSAFRLFRKLDGYLKHISATRPAPLESEIEINIHPDSDPSYFPLLATQTEYVASRGATLLVVRG